MKSILGIECATDVLSVALASGGNVIAEKVVKGRNIHDELLYSLTASILEEQHIAIADLGGIAVSSGPGSFTGLRIGMSFAKGLVYGAGLPLATIPTFDGIAHRIALQRIAPPDGLLALLFDARREDVYVGIYRLQEDRAVCLAPARVCRIDTLCDIIREGMICAGSGAEKIGGALQKEVVLLGGESVECRAGAIALLGAARIATGDTADAASCEPEYLKEFFTTAG